MRKPAHFAPTITDMFPNPGRAILRVLLLLALSNPGLAHACRVADDITWYFGWEQGISDGDFELDEVVSENIKRTKTITFEEEPIIFEHHRFYLRYGMLYVKGVPTEFIDGSFKYLGNGYFRLHGQIYYRGQREADYPAGAVVKTWSYMHDDPPPAHQDGPPILPICPSFARPVFVLETSTGLHLEHEERPGHSQLPGGRTCKRWTGHTCAELRRMGEFDDSRFRIGE
ncbi:hypothetical protein [Paraburkholderia bannensis]|uniref:hypothetical protein n=1 Tax=Paraburkholderia bannensis TaxID=765414 RepID=UPI002AB64101|nr:hypothetical protein [Paraburkholderia bannensis]